MSRLAVFVVAAVVFVLTGWEFSDDTGRVTDNSGKCAEIEPLSATVSAPTVETQLRGPALRPCASITTTAQRTRLSGDFDTNDFSQWQLCQSIAYNGRCSAYSGSHYSMQVITDPTKPRNRVGRFEVRDGDVPFCCGERAQVRLSDPLIETEGADLWYNWAFALDRQFPNTSRWQLIMQWHASQDGSPPVGFFIEGNELRLRIHPYPNGPYGGVRDIWSNPIVKGVRMDIKLHIRWSADPSSGFIELWKDGVRQTFTGDPTNGNGTPCVGADRCTVRTLVPGDAGNWVALGYYRDHAISGTGVVYHDSFTVSKSAR